MRRGAYFYVESDISSYRTIGVPKCRILCYIPSATQKKIRQLYKNADLTKVFHLIREKFYLHIRSKKKQDLKATENVGKFTIEGRDIFIIATRVYDEPDEKNSILYMSRTYSINISERRF